MGTPMFFSCGRTEMSEKTCTHPDRRGMTAGGDRETSDTLWQPSASESRISRLEASFYDLEQRVTWLQEEIQTLPGYGIQKQLQEKEEQNKKLKVKIKELEAKNKKLMSTAMAMHKDSENMNDPLRLSAVLQKYEVLRIHDWEKFKGSVPLDLACKSDCNIIKKLFDACEKDIQQRTTKIFEVLDIPLLNDAMTSSIQGIMQEIKNILRYSCFQEHSELYRKIVMDPPVKAVWTTEEISTKYFEHVDKKRLEYCRKPAILWPIMTREEQVLVKGVIYDEK